MTTDFLSNPNVASVLVEKVPCSFAKPDKHGGVGTHFTMVLTNKAGHIMYVGSECEQKHGDSVEFFHSEGSATCFKVTAAFREALASIKNTKGVANYAPDVVLPSSKNLKYAINSAWEVMKAAHNSRISADYTLPLKQVALQNTVTKLANHLMTLPKVKLAEDTSETVKRTALVTPLVVMNDLGYSPEFQYRLCPADNTGIRLALRRYDGSWDVQDDRVLSFAERNADCVNWPVEQSKHHGKVRSTNTVCSFCGGTFERMSKHLAGAKHKNRVLEIVRLLCKATTPTGLKMINNPKHRSAFFR